MILCAAAFQLVLGMLVFSALEAWFALDPSRRWWRRRFWTDAALWLVHPVAYACGMAFAVALVGEHDRSSLPSWAQLVIAFVAIDFGSYVLHRLYHRVPILWRLHVVHHTSKQVDWLSTSRLHPLSQTMNAAVLSAPLLYCGLSTRSLITANAIIGFWAVIVHANVRIDLGRLGTLVVSPAFHRRHHDSAGHEQNLGAVLAIWDRLFGTSDGPVADKIV